MRRIIFGLLSSLLAVACSSSKATELDQPVPYSLSTYSSLLPKILFRNSPPDPYIRMMCFPSFEREWGVAIETPQGERTTVEYVIAERSIWQDAHPQDIGTHRTTASITNATAQTLHEAWTQVFQRPERMKVRNFTKDGVACRFESVTMEGNRVSAETWTPRSEYPTGVLVELGEMVRELTQVEASDQPSIELRINQKSKDVLAWSRKLDQPRDAVQLELQAFVSDTVGFTLRKSPVLYYYISKATLLPIHFTLVDIRAVSPAAEVPLRSPTPAGVWAIRLQDYDIVLEVGVQYRWYVSVTRNPGTPTQNIVAGGVIERVDLDLVNYDGRTCDRNGVRYLMGAGIWYDAFACLNELTEANSQDRSLRDLRDKLLEGPKSFGYSMPTEPRYREPSRKKISR